MLAVVENLGAPVRVLAFSGILILKAGPAVKVGQTMCVLWKMSGYPVQNHTDTVLVKVVYKVHKVLGCAVAGGGSEISRHLIAPGAVIRMLRNAHQLYVGVAHLFYVSRQLMGGFSICIEAVFFLSVLFPPGTQVNLVNAYGHFSQVGLPAG